MINSIHEVIYNPIVSLRFYLTAVICDYFGENLPLPAGVELQFFVFFYHIHYLETELLKQPFNYNDCYAIVDCC